jgi:hypothetical protein
MLDLHKAACLLKVLAILMSVGIVDTNTARNVRTGAFYRSIVIAWRHQTAWHLFREPVRGSKVAHSPRLLHAGGPSAPISQLVASIRRGGRDKAEDWGPSCTFGG